MARTIFVVGGSGFIGSELCRVCVAAGDEVLALSRSDASAQKLRAAGATPVRGDLLEPGAWQRTARAAEYVVHVAQPDLAFGRMSTRWARRYGRAAARALAHLLGQGVTGERYFLVDDRPGPLSAMQALAARELRTPLRVLRVPIWLVAVLMGRILVESLQVNFVLSNARLKALGFTFQYPTIDTGIAAAVARLRSRTLRPGSPA